MVPISRNAPMQANASDGAKVLPIARIWIRNTGMFRTTAEASGKSTNGLQPPRRLRSHDNDGAYASEKRSAVRISEVIVALLRSTPLPFTNENVVTINNNADNQEPREIESNFITGLVWASAFSLWTLVFDLTANQNGERSDRFLRNNESAR
jgi:hypothetical protein